MGRLRATVRYATPSWTVVARGTLVAALLGTELIFLRITLDPFEFPKALVLWACAIALATVGMCRLVAEYPNILACLSLMGLPSRIRADPLGWGVLLLVASTTLTTMLSMSPRTSFHGAHECYGGLVTVVSFAVLFFATRTLCESTAQRRWLLVVAVVGGAGAAAYGLFQWLRQDPWCWEGVSGISGYERPFGTMGHANHLGALLAMTLPLAGYVAVRAAGVRRWRMAAGVALLVAFEAAVIAITLSRGAWLAVIGAASVFAVGLMRYGRHWIKGTLAGVGLVSVGLAVVFLTGTSNRIGERLRHWHDSDSRLLIWRAAWSIFCSRPLLGCGPDTFQLAFAHERTPEYWRQEWNVTPTRAHNEVLHLLATQGLLGGAAFGLLAVGAGWAMVRAWRGNEPERDFLIAVCAALAAFALESLFSFTVIGTGTLLFVLLGTIPVAATGPSRVRSASGSWGRAWCIPVVQAAIAMGGGALFLWFTVLPLCADMACRSGDSCTPGREAVRAYERAVGLTPADAFLWSKLGAAYLAMAENESSSPDCALLGQARHCFEQAVALEPRSADHHDNLAQTLARLASRSQCSAADAFAEFDRALALDPANVEYCADAARAALLVHDPARVRGYSERGLALYPDFGPLRAQLAYASVFEGRLAQGKSQLQEALACNWYGDWAAQEAAARLLGRLDRARLPAR